MTAVLGWRHPFWESVDSEPTDPCKIWYSHCGNCSKNQLSNVNLLLSPSWISARLLILTFSVGHGGKQGWILAPTIFTICLAAVLKSMPEELGDLYIRTRRYGDLFNLRHLKAKNKKAGTTDPRAALCGWFGTGDPQSSGNARSIDSLCLSIKEIRTND